MGVLVWYVAQRISSDKACPKGLPLCQVTDITGDVHAPPLLSLTCFA